MRSRVLAALLCLQGAAWGADGAAQMQRGEELVMGRCFLCHGATGDSSSPLARDSVRDPTGWPSSI